MLTITVQTIPSYPLHIDEGLLFGQALLACCQAHGNTVVIVTDENIAPLYAQALKAHLEQICKVHLIVCPAGETYKTRQTKAMIEDEMLSLGCGRDTCLVALGGGTITDLAGFVAATYCRGIPAILCPTSLLAMADASIGGKTGLNTAFGKNLIGTFSQPVAVFMDTKTLDSLPEPLYREGLSEVLKHALIHSPALFEQLQQDSPLKRDNITDILLASCKVKCHYVEQDPYEAGPRKVLNYGHTIGHALETLSDYQLSHGQAVAIGLLLESLLSMQLGLLPSVSYERIKTAILKDALFPSPLPEAYCQIDPLISLMRADKKAKANIPHFVLLKEIGQPYIQQGKYAHPVEGSILKDLLCALSAL
jgi:3-dehydroquinate synthase